jgi:hypothetical protein
MNRSRVRPAIFVYWGYVLIATFYPFELSPDFTPSDSHFTGGVETLLLNGWHWLGLRDFLLNILLFLPCGALLYCLWATGHRSNRLTFVLVTLCGASVSFLIESGQAFASRDSSALDVIANTLGTTVGALVYGQCKRRNIDPLDRCAEYVSSKIAAMHSNFICSAAGSFLSRAVHLAILALGSSL